jgi:hypothetical protein
LFDRKRAQVVLFWRRLVLSGPAQYNQFETDFQSDGNVINLKMNLAVPDDEVNHATGPRIEF